MFQLICQTCGEDRTYDEFDLCQEQFNDHVDRNHEVELLRTGSTSRAAETQSRDGSKVD